MASRRRHLFVTTILLTAAACSRDDAPTGPELAPTSGPAATETRRYIVRDLGTLGGRYSYAFGLNSRAEVVGGSATAGGPDHAFLWRRGTMIDLGSLEGSGGSSAARGINDDGDIVGQSSTGAGVARAFLWRQGVMTELFTPGGSSGANSINGLGHVVGYAEVNGDPHPALWKNGGFTDLGTLGGPFGEATDINDRGQIVGGARVSPPNDDQYHAFLWENGVMKDLGTLGGPSSWAQGINQDGDIVGWSETTSRETHAVLWKDGRMIDLGLFEGRQTFAYAINADELKAGFTAGGDAGPVVWRFRQAQALPTLGRPGGSATDINERGQIVGSSLRRDLDEHAVLWRPE